mgnify:FL=1
MQLFDATLLALRCHGMNAEQLGKLLPFDLSVGIQKGLRLCGRVGHHVAHAVPGADQAGDGTVPAEFVSERSVGERRSAAP